MPGSSRQLRLGDVRETLCDRCFSPESPRLVGVELEWLTVAPAEQSERVRPARLAPALAGSGPLPGGSTITFEPGGQLEVSAPPRAALGEACAVAMTDVARARATVSALGVELVGLGADPLRRPRRVVDTPRYAAMEAYFDADGPAGRRMMANTAAVQVNLGVGPTLDDAGRQWRLAHRLGPTLAAAFANSPLLEGRPTGFRSVRLATWLALDRTRAAPVDWRRPGPEAWADYVLDARVMLIRSTPERFVALGSPLSLRQWVHDGHGLGWPTADDVDYHLGTLFPPVRPRGWLEMRMLDALPDPWWQVAVAVTAALLDDPEAGAAAGRAVSAGGAADRWVDAARTGLSHPGIAASARGCFDAALASLDRSGDAPLAELVEAYSDRWVRRGRCPADDLLDAWAGHRGLFPEPAQVPA